MRQDIKELADAMERGWKQFPTMHRGSSFKTDANDKVIACCAIGHTMVGSGNFSGIYYSTIHIVDQFPPLFDQLVYYPSGFKGKRVSVTRSSRDGRLDGTLCTLWDVIVSLNDDYKWNTPQIIKWLRSHQND